MGKKLVDEKQNESQDLANLEWAISTPRQQQYCLEMFDDDGVAIQEINVTREEYIRLKLHLAKMRGVKIPTAKPEAVASDSHALGFYIETAIWDEVEPEQLTELASASA